MFEGRIDRIGYLLGSIYLTLLCLVLIIAFGASINFAQSFSFESVASQTYFNLVSFFSGVIFTGLFIASCISLTMRRFHDINQSGLLILLTLIPYVGFIFSLMLLFIPGTDGGNRFGASEKSRDFIEVLFGKKIKERFFVSKNEHDAAAQKPVLSNSIDQSNIQQS